MSVKLSNVIGVCGFKGSGKDTFSNFLVTEHKYVKLNFASALKDILSTIFGWPRELLEGDTKESREFREKVDEWWANKLSIKDLTPRMMLQMVGTDLFRVHFHDSIWVSIVEKQILKLLESGSKVVISDCRFPNEISMIKKLGGVIVHVERVVPSWFSKYKNGEDIEDALKLHPSEISWIREDFDFVVPNDYKTIDELYKKLIENVK